MSDWDGIPEHWGLGHYRDTPVCKLVQQARDRQIAALKKQDDPLYSYYYDDAEADRVVKFMSLLRQFEGQWFGKPFVLEAWQEWDIVRPLFGWRIKNSGLRRYRNAYVEIARGNGKSTLAAAMAAYLLLADKEYAAQVYCAATKSAQARIVWECAKKMIDLSPELRGYIKAYKSSLYFERLGSTFKPLGRDSDTQDGFSVHGGIIDEYHAHKTSEMRDVLSSGRRSRRQPLLFTITTAGFGLASPCKIESDLVKRILNPDDDTENDSYFGYICTVDDPSRWDDPDEWVKANPNWGISVNAEQFQVEYDEAAQSPAKQNAFKCKRLNIWTEQASRWISMARYAENDGDIDWSRFKGQRCFAGLDLGLTRDLSAFVLAFMGETLADEHGAAIPPPIYILAKFWCPEIGIEERYKNDGVNYPIWAKEGWLTKTPGETTRNDHIKRDILQLATEFEIAEISVDQMHASELIQQLADEGFTINKHSQSMAAMNFPCRSLEQLVLERRFKHANNPILRWMFSNVAIVRDGNENMKVMKNKSGDRVDGVVAAAMAVGRLLIAPEPVKFVYNSRGLYVA